MVVDEAHCLKNPKGLRYKNMDAFSTDRRLLLTGEFKLISRVAGACSRGSIAVY